MSEKLLLLLCCLFNLYSLTLNQSVTLPDPSDLCPLFKDGVKLRKPGSCTEYMTCRNGIATYSACSAGQFYDRDKQTCVEKENLSTTDDYCRNRCEGKNDGEFIPDPVSCRGFLYCSNGQPMQSYCPQGQFFVEKKGKPQCVYENDSECTVVPNICEIAPHKSIYRDAKNCMTYYECEKGATTEKKCKNQYFNIETGKCDEISLVPCTTHKVPKCSKNKESYHEDGATCRGYYHCRKLENADENPKWLQCPEGQFFCKEKQKCTDPIHAKCTYNRCQGRPNMMVQSSENDCRSFFTCRDGLQVESKPTHCDGDKFFDELAQACLLRIVQYDCCKDK